MNINMCTICNIEKDTNNFYIGYSECRECNRARGLKRTYEDKDKISNQQKLIYEKIEIDYYYRSKTLEIYNLEI